ncbi:MAG: GAF domain-containing protein, partial [Deltaproteobacteria bacterium]
MAPLAADPILATGELVDREVALSELLKTLVARIARSMDADRGTLFLLDPTRGELFTTAAELPELPEIRLKVGQGVAGYVAKHGEPVNVPTTDDDPRFYRGVDEETGYVTRSILAVPVPDSSGRIIGVVQLLNKLSGAFTSEDCVRLQELARQAGVALEATTLYDAIYRRPEGAEKPVPLACRFNRILGESPAMQQAYRLLTRAADSEATVLIRGESGTGKELFARAVHVNSRRRSGPFVKVDCAALPAQLIENELFGHERGAYTGAERRAEGKVDAAAGGTLFLDEIGELPLAAQGKLLRLLQDHEFDRVGGTQPVKADVRIVAATNRNLEEMVEAGTFRSDLYYRIKVVELFLPPLRERGRSDLVALTRHFLVAAARRHGRPVRELSEEAWERLSAWHWPGNVRELENCIESAVVIGEGQVLEADDLPLPTRT